MADSLLGEVEVPLAPLTEEDFLDTWLPLRSSGGRGDGKSEGGAGGEHAVPTAGWKVRVQVLLSFLLMCSKETQQRASVEAALRAGRARGESALAGADAGAAGVAAAHDVGYEEEEEEAEEDDEVIRATMMMDDLG